MHILDVPWAEKQQFDWDGKTWQVHQPNIADQQQLSYFADCNVVGVWRM